MGFMAERAATGWKSRLKAWWDGYELRRPAADKPAKRDMNEIRAEQIEQDLGNSVIWSVQRIRIAEALWGPDLHTPGDTDFISTLIKPFGLNESMSALDLGAGLGGAARLIARKTGAWVTGLESDQVLQRSGLARSIKAGMERKAPVEPFEWEDLTFPKRYDAIFSKEVLFTVRDKQKLFAALAAAMKPRGHLMFTDYVLKHSGKPGAAVAEWREAEAVRPYPMTISQASEFLKELHFDVRIAEDISDKHREIVLSAWEALTHTLPEKARDLETRQLAVEEAEMWMRRIAALETGDLRLYRFYALAPSGE
jgi:cyclopropane fatty-acyl-phospholipid synthase-like methyltransferase